MATDRRVAAAPPAAANATAVAYPNLRTPRRYAFASDHAFHSLRRTYASLRCACGDDVRYTADQLGHEDPRFTLKVYAQAAKRRDRLSGVHRKAYDRALVWAQLGSGD